MYYFNYKKYNYSVLWNNINEGPQKHCFLIIINWPMHQNSKSPPPPFLSFWESIPKLIRYVSERLWSIALRPFYYLFHKRISSHTAVVSCDNRKTKLKTDCLYDPKIVPIRKLTIARCSLYQPRLFLHGHFWSRDRPLPKSINRRGNIGNRRKDSERFSLSKRGGSQTFSPFCILIAAFLSLNPLSGETLFFRCRTLRS